MNSYTLIITEKPDASCRIAHALDDMGSPIKKVESGVPYYVAKGTEEIVVVPALGHLYTVAGKKTEKKTYPVFSFQWVPKHLVERGSARVHTWLNVISKLAEKAHRFIDACDYDIEGSIIGYSILKYACDKKEKTALRMKYSTLTKEELKKSYMNLLSHLDFALIEAGLTRHEVDWLYGINLSRALTQAVKNYSGRYAQLSTGRVQGPTLKFLEARERRIKCFVPKPYWTIKTEMEIGNAIFEVVYEKTNMDTKEETEAIVSACNGKDGEIVRIWTKKSTQVPPLPFDLGSLQGEAYRLFKYSPMRTSNIAQRLYLDALISYPRTGSQKLPPVIGYETILKGLSRKCEYAGIVCELLAKSCLHPREGKRNDSAHPAIYPTGNLPERALCSTERNIWDLIVRRFMAVFGEPAILQNVKADIRINGNKFHFRGRQIFEKGWFRFCKPYLHFENTPLPIMREGQKAKVKRMVLENKLTKPPPRYNPSSLLKKMEKEEIGTKATRAGIIHTLQNRKYIREERMVVTPLGLEVIAILKKYSPTVVSIELTRKLEEKMQKIQQGKEIRENVLLEAVQLLEPIIKKLKENERTIGARLTHALREARLEKNVISVCPVCRDGNLLILRSKRTGKRFIGCTNYFEGKCTNSYPLPQKGLVKPTGSVCKSCGWPTLRIWIKGTRSWNLCFNPKCALREYGTKDAELTGV